jgi:hypothetical protein
MGPARAQWRKVAMLRRALAIDVARQWLRGAGLQAAPRSCALGRL